MGVHTRDGLALAVHEVTTSAAGTDFAVSTEKADPSPLPNMPLFDTGADCIDRPDHLMSGHARIGDARKNTFDGQSIAAANSAGLNANANVPGGRIRQAQFHRLQPAGR